MRGLQGAAFRLYVVAIVGTLILCGLVHFHTAFQRDNIHLYMIIGGTRCVADRGGVGFLFPSYRCFVVVIDVTVRVRIYGDEGVGI